METFVDRIKEKYRDRLVNREKQWPPCHSSKLIRLELVERRKGENYLSNQPRGNEIEDSFAYQIDGREDENHKQTHIAYDQLFKGKKQIRKILAEGDAGIGKTTLSISISEDWANGKLFEQFELVLLLPLRLNKVASAGSLHELLKVLHTNSRNCDAVVNYLDEEEGRNVLIIADGWDELCESKREENSFLYTLLFESFPLLSVVVASRPSSSTQLHRLPYIDRFVEIHGFDEDDIEEYILSEFADNEAKADHLISQLESNPLLESVCSIPLSCAIVCHLWRVTEETLPTNLTQLYTEIILNIILRNINKIDAFKNVKIIPSFDDIPADLKDSWWLLCRFALHAIREDRIVFSQKELNSFSQDLALDKNIFKSFGLLQLADSIVETGCEASFHFLHLTFQEYLAALYLVKQLSGMSFTRCESELSLLYAEKRRYSIIWRFFFGIGGCDSQSNSDLFNQMYRKLMSVTFFVNDHLLLYHCAFEANNKSITQALTENPSLELSDRLVPLTAHDCNAILYVIANLQKYDGMILKFDTCNENQIKALTDSLACKQGKLQVKSLSLSGSRLADNIVMNLLHKASAAFCSLECLGLSDNEIGCETVKAIKLSINSLSELDLSYNPIGITGLQALLDTICSGALAKLKKLHLQESLSDDDSTNRGFIEALSTNCPLLMEVNFAENNLTSSSVIMTLARVVSSGSQIQSLIISESRLGDCGLNIFLNSLKDTYHIAKLEVQGNGIHGRSVSCLANDLYSKKILTLGTTDSGFYLDDNPLRLQGTAAVFKILSCCHYQHKLLSLSRCQLTCDDNDINLQDIQISNDEAQSSNLLTNITGRSFFQMPQNTSVIKLVLDGNDFSGESSRILGGFLHLCPCLELLSSKDCGIDSDVLQQIVQQLQDTQHASFPCPCSKLQHWDLDYNSINDSGIALLIHHLSSLFPQLGYGAGIMYLGPTFLGNPISYEMMKRFVKQIQERLHPHLTYDDLSDESEEEEVEQFNITDTTPIHSLGTEQTITAAEDKALSQDVTELSPFRLESESVKEHHESCSTTGSFLDQLSSILPRDESVQCHVETRVVEDIEDSENTLRLVQYPSKKQRLNDVDISSLPDIEHHLLDLLKWENEHGSIRELRIYDNIAHKWKKVATRLGFELGRISSIEKNYSDDDDRVTAVFKVWFENAKGLSNADKYPKSWRGLINLLNDSELSEVAIDLHTALSSPKNSVRKNL